MQPGDAPSRSRARCSRSAFINIACLASFQSRAKWWEEELEAWTLVAGIAHDCEHRATRLALVDALRRWGDRHRWPRAPLAYRDYLEIVPRGGLDRALAGLRSVARRAEAEAKQCPAPRSAHLEDPDTVHRACGERADAWRFIRVSVTSDSRRDGSLNGSGTVKPPEAVAARVGSRPHRSGET